MNQKIKDSLDKSVLCWLATSTLEGLPNVSPKEVFTHLDEKIIIANIASPQTIKNIESNPQVCISFIDILIQKGWQLKGTATILKKKDTSFNQYESLLLEMTKGEYPFSTITCISVTHSKPILAPSYIMKSDRTEADQINAAKKQYGF